MRRYRYTTTSLVVEKYDTCTRCTYLYKVTSNKILHAAVVEGDPHGPHEQFYEAKTTIGKNTVNQFTNYFT